MNTRKAALTVISIALKIVIFAALIVIFFRIGVLPIIMVMLFLKRKPLTSLPEGPSRSP